MSIEKKLFRTIWLFLCWHLFTLLVSYLQSSFLVFIVHWQTILHLLWYSIHKLDRIRPIHFAYITNTFFKSNNIEYSWKMGILEHFGSFLSHFYMFFALFGINNQNKNNHPFWMDFPILTKSFYLFDSSVFNTIWLFRVNNVKFLISIYFVSICFMVWITSFLSQFNLFKKHRLWRFNSAMN